MEYPAYLSLGTLIAGTLLYGLWYLVNRFDKSGFVIPGALTLPAHEDVPDDFICILLDERRGGDGTGERESKI